MDLRMGAAIRMPGLEEALNRRAARSAHSPRGLEQGCAAASGRPLGAAAWSRPQVLFSRAATERSALRC